MKLYDEAIARCEALLKTVPARNCAVDGREPLWERESQQHILFRKDTAYELGGGSLPAWSGAAFTSNENVRDEIVVCGPDLSQLREDNPYARLAILRVDDGSWTDNAQAYRVLSRLDYTRYHVHPKGFMMRISAAAHREPVRVGKEALRAGLDFGQVGRLFLAAYHEHPEVLGAKIVFVTDPKFPYDAFGEEVQKMDAITESLNEIFQNLIMDCAACRLKPVCDEVEGMRELHFAQYQDNLAKSE